MKRGGILFLAVLCCAGLTACGDESGIALPYDEQITVMAKFNNTWEVEDQTHWWAYAVTDLDQNGSLELISTQTRGTGLFTDSCLYTLLPSREESDFGIEKHDAPPFEPKYDQNGGTAPIPVYYDKTEDAYYYILEDFEKDGMFRYYETVYGGKFAEDHFETELLARKITEYDENGEETVSYQNGEGDTIDGKSYESAAELRYEDLQPMEAKLRWIEMQNFESIGTEQERIDLLTASYDEFSLAEK